MTEEKIDVAAQAIFRENVRTWAMASTIDRIEQIARNSGSYAEIVRECETVCELGMAITRAKTTEAITALFGAEGPWMLATLWPRWLAGPGNEASHASDDVRPHEANRD